VFEMEAPVHSPAKCEVRSVIRFLNATVEGPAKIRKQIVAVYGNVMEFQLLHHLKKHLAGKKFDDDDEVQEEVMSHDLVQRAGGGLLRLGDTEAGSET